MQFFNWVNLRQLCKLPLSHEFLVTQFFPSSQIVCNAEILCIGKIFSDSIFAMPIYIQIVAVCANPLSVLSSHRVNQNYLGYLCDLWSCSSPHARFNPGPIIVLFVCRQGKKHGYKDQILGKLRNSFMKQSPTKTLCKIYSFYHFLVTSPYLQQP